MKIYFPQWQGAGNKSVLNGAKALLNTLDEQNFYKIPLSEKDSTPSSKVNYHGSLVDQLSKFRSVLEEKKPETLQILGGDCGLEIIPVSYLNHKYAPHFAAIWFDAHADSNLPHESPSHNFHGMPLRTLTGEGPEAMIPLLFSKLLPSQIFYVGLRETDPQEKVFIKKHKLFTTRQTDPFALVNALRANQIKHIYIHFDTDVLDPSAYAHTFYQVPGGLHIHEAITYIKTLKEHFNTVGSSLLESVASHKSQLHTIDPIIKMLFA
ncbi:arginase family protein [Ascidiimonas aurantiaca]|uniref:arginase family protein n=1 Tax=Ascidiimonas aurantiaca TaxID=1685432 RepID=UPI0030EEAF36